MFSTLTHEIGHVLGAWKGGAATEVYVPYTDTEAGTWTGPNVELLSTVAPRRSRTPPMHMPGSMASAGSGGNGIRFCPQRRLRLAHGLLRPWRGADPVSSASDRLRVPRRPRDDHCGRNRQARDLRPCGLDRPCRLHPRCLARSARGARGPAAALRWRSQSVADARDHRSSAGGCRCLRLPQHGRPRHVLSLGRVHGKGLLRGRADRRRNRS